MNLLDYGMIFILGYCLVRGIFRGMIKELSAIVGVMGGFYFAFSYYDQMAKHLGRYITSPGYANIVGFLVLFVAVYLVISITGVIIKYLLNIAFLGWADRVGGAVFGGLKGVLIVAVMVVMLTTFLPKNPPALRDSLVVRETSEFSAILVKIASTEIKTLFDTHLKELKTSWHPTGK